MKYIDKFMDVMLGVLIITIIFGMPLCFMADSNPVFEIMVEIIFVILCVNTAIALLIFVFMLFVLLIGKII